MKIRYLHRAEMKLIISTFFIYFYLVNLTCQASPATRLPSLKNRKMYSTIRGTAGEPLLLTPLVDAGKLAEAKNRSRVTPPLMDEIESYTGYLTVNRTTRSHLFFWFIPNTRTDYTSAPLILWLNGGPGCSSMLGLFNENGPFEVIEKRLRKRKYAWTNNYNMLYIDQPVGAGFSFTEDEKGYISTEEEVGEYLYEALIQFYKIFPDLKDHDFFISGESYAGKYIPAIGYKILTVNQESPAPEIPLRGLMIGNGFSDPEFQLDYAEYLHELGLIDKKLRREMEDDQERIKFYIRSKEWKRAFELSNQQLRKIRRAIGSIDLFDYTRDGRGLDDSFVEFITRDEIRERIHVGAVGYTLFSKRVEDQFIMDEMQSVRPWIEALLEHYPILFYSGQFDIMVAHTMTEKFLENLHWSGARRYSEVENKIWRAGDKVAGFYKSAGNLVYLLVRNTGHMVPTGQPENALRMIDMFIEKKLQDNSTNVV